jgi:hypothetical protein
MRHALLPCMHESCWHGMFAASAAPPPHIARYFLGCHQQYAVACIAAAVRGWAYWVTPELGQ